MESLESRDAELILALKALTLRFPPGRLTQAREAQLNSMAKRAHGMAMQRIVMGRVELSTLQTLCLVGMVFFLGQLLWSIISQSRSDTERRTAAI